MMIIIIIIIIIITIIIIIIIITPHWSFEEGAKKKGLLNDLEPFKMPERVC